MKKAAKDILIGDKIIGMYGPWGYVPEMGEERVVKHIKCYPVAGEGEHYIFSVEIGDGMYMVPENQEIEIVDEENQKT